MDDVAEIDADAKADAFGLQPVGVPVRHSLLDYDGAAHGVDDRGELDQNAVAGGLEDAAAVLGDQRIDQFAPIAFESGEGSLLVRSHQPRIAGDIGTEDCRQPPLDAFFRHDALPAATQSISLHGGSQASLSRGDFSALAKFYPTMSWTSKNRSVSPVCWPAAVSIACTCPR
jgi:hypothetical protein